MKPKSFFVSLGILPILLLGLTVSCGHDINCLPDSHFNADGKLITEIDSVKTMVMPSNIKFFMEASGSMNGLYRPGCKTEFRDDVYQIVSYYLKDNDFVYTLCEDNGKSGRQYTLTNFATAIKNQGFPTMGNTSITEMIETVTQNIDTTMNEVGVLISDMKFDPDGLDNIDYQLGMYTTKVSHITSETKLAFSLVGAKSKYYDSNNNVVADESPYYFLIIGKSENVAKVRDDISTMLHLNNNFIDNIETGMKYGGVNYSLKNIKNCLYPDNNNPTFVGVDNSTQCKIQLNIDLKNYRWIIPNEEVIRKSFSCKMIHGSTVNIDSIMIDTSYIDGQKQLNRKAIASINLSVSNLMTDCDVIEWQFNPNEFETVIGTFEPYFNADSWKDFSKTYSIEYFLKGLFRAAHLNTYSNKPNYILISTHS